MVATRILAYPLLSLTLLAVLANNTFAGPPATINDLAWMTGSWAGAVGANRLEERWTDGHSGSIAAVVRMTGSDATMMYELITIEEVEDSLVLNLQQWDPGMQSRSDGPQTMVLDAISQNSVKFKAVGDTGPMISLAYSRPGGDAFVIHVEVPGREMVVLNLSANVAGLNRPIAPVITMPVMKNE
jgi:hypothetical protein